MTPLTPPADRHHARAWVAGAATLALVAAAQAFYPISPLSYWPATSVAGNVVFEVNLVAAPPNIPTPPLLDGSASWNTAFVDQMNAWNAVLPDDVLHLQANTASGLPPVQGDGKNDVFFSSTVYGDTWGSSTLGICLSMWSGNERTEADILFNATKTWNAYTGNLQGGTSEFRRVAQHELGHALLLDHPDDVGQSVSAIMNSQMSNTDALTTDDRAGVLSVFGGLVPATITVQPRQLVTTSGGQFLLNVTATGSEPMTYQWQRSTNGGTSWSDLAGFDFPNGSASGFADGNLLRVVVTNPAGSVTSRPVQLTVTGASAPVVEVDPTAMVVDERGDAIFTVHATGSRMPTYQWEYSADGGGTWGPMFSSFGPTDVTGTTSSTLKITHAIAAMDGYRFRCVATNPAGSATSGVATLTVNAGGPDPFFTWHPLDVYTTAGVTTLLPAGVSGTPGPDLQWQASDNGGLDWADLSNNSTYGGATTETLLITNPTVDQSGTLYRLRASNSSGTALSRSALLSVRGTDTAPTILDQPDNTQVPAGQIAIFTSRVAALPAPVLHWEYSADGVTYTALMDGLFEIGTTTLDTVVSGAHTRMLALVGLDASLHTYRFRLVARNEAGSVASDAAILSIGDAGIAPTITAHPVDAGVTYPGDASFTVAATGLPAPSIRWERSTDGGTSWVDVADDATHSGATSTTLQLTDPGVAMSGQRFRAVATNTVGSDTSTTAVLTVAPAAATVTLSDLSRTHTGAPLAATATTVPAGLAVSLTYDGSGVAPSEVGNYAVVATVTAPNYTGSANGTLTIVPGITPGQTGTVTTVAGAATTLSVTASTGDGTTYQWQIQDPDTMAWGDLAGATGASLVIASTQPFSAGAYRVVVTFGGVSSTGAPVTVAVDDPPPSDARLMNLSTRALCQTGDSVLIPGFFIQGTGTKRLLMRAVGPELLRLGVPGVLADPQMVLRRRSDDSVVATNDDWGDNANWQEIRDAAQSVFAFSLAQGSADAALLLDLPPGGYTIVASGQGDQTGVAIVELYELSGSSETTRLTNISNRGHVGVGGNIMIPGFVVSNDGSRRFLIRAVGPSLARFGVTGLLADPVMEIYKRRPGTATDDLILTNDTWGENGEAEDIRQAAVAVSAFRLEDGSADAALLVTLPPGAYTVNARGKDGSTGVAIVEVYLIP